MGGLAQLRDAPRSDRGLRRGGRARDEQAIERSDKRLRRLACELTAEGGDYGLAEIDDWLEGLRDVDGAGGSPPDYRVRDLCDGHADAWERLRRHMSCVAEVDGAAHERFRETRANLAALLAKPL